MEHKRKHQHQLPPTKIAVLVDGGFFLKRFNALYNKERTLSPEDIADCLHNMALRLTGSNTLYRIFYYDCEPLNKKFHNPITHRAIDFGKSDEHTFRCAFFDALRRKRKVALRLGTLKDNGHWLIHPDATKQLLAGKITVNDLSENDLYMDIRQKGIDMKIAVDIASLALKRLVDTIILVAGDADFVPAAKLARREGIDFILHPMSAHIDPSLFEHIDGLSSVRPLIKNDADEIEKK
jgi:uncharacterized LabA/DUF88 family protein